MLLFFVVDVQKALPVTQYEETGCGKSVGESGSEARCGECWNLSDGTCEERLRFWTGKNRSTLIFDNERHKGVYVITQPVQAIC